MENATKALLIAAAVIVAILLIALGMGVFTTASEQVEGAGDMTEYQIQQHNGKFDKYLGDSQTGANVNAMLTAVFNHNLSQEQKVTVVNDTKSVLTGTETSPADKVSTGNKYAVTAEYSKAGMITKITISKPLS